MFEVYTYFGRIVSTHKIPSNETHHNASELARKSLVSFESKTGGPAWVRYVKDSI